MGRLLSRHFPDRGRGRLYRHFRGRQTHFDRAVRTVLSRLPGAARFCLDCRRGDQHEPCNAVDHGLRLESRDSEAGGTMSRRPDLLSAIRLAARLNPMDARRMLCVGAARLIRIDPDLRSVSRTRGTPVRRECW